MIYSSRGTHSTILGLFAVYSTLEEFCNDHTAWHHSTAFDQWGKKTHTHTVSEKLRNRPTINGKYFIPLHHLVWHTVIDVSRDHGGTIWRVGQTKDASAHPTTRRKPCVPPAKSVCRLHASQSSRRCYRTSTATCAPAFQLAQQHRLSWHAGHEAVAVMILRNVYNYVPFDTA